MKNTRPDAARPDGRAAIRQIRGIEQAGGGVHTAIALLTAHVGRDDIESSLQAGADGSCQCGSPATGASPCGAGRQKGTRTRAHRKTQAMVRNTSLKAVVRA